MAQEDKNRNKMSLNKEKSTLASKNIASPERYQSRQMLQGSCRSSIKQIFIMRLEKTCIRYQRLHQPRDHLDDMIGLFLIIVSLPNVIIRSACSSTDI